MSLSEQTPRVDATASTTTDAIPFAYPFAADSELYVVSDERGLLVLDTDYSVTGAGDDAGGTVTMIDVGQTVPEEIAIIRNTPVSQLLTLRISGKYFIADVESALDKLTKLLQETQENLARCLQSSVIDGAALALPDAAERANKAVVFDENGDLDLGSISFAGVSMLTKSYTGLVGGTSSDMDDLATVSFPIGTVVFLPSITIGASVLSRHWVLKSGTEATDLSSGKFRPVDYAASTNEKYWEAV